MPAWLTRILRPATIRGKLVLLSSGSLLLASLLVLVLILYQQQRLIRDEWADSLYAQARLVATNSQASLAFQDRNEAGRLLRAVESNPSILRARLLVGGRQEVFAEFVSPNRGQTVPSDLPAPQAKPHFGSGVLVVWAPVPGDETGLARVELIASLEPMRIAVLRTALESGLALLVALVLSLWLSGRLVRRLSAPVEELSRLMSRFTADTGLRDRVQPQGDDEIARLAEAARTGKAAREELSGSTITITSLGPLGGIVTTPVINHPEVAIVGVGGLGAWKLDGNMRLASYGLAASGAIAQAIRYASRASS